MRRQLEVSASDWTALGGVGGVVLCAGMGTRMGALTENRPKPLLPVLNCPLLWWNLERMGREVQRIALNVHYLQEAFAQLPKFCRDRGLQVELVHEPVLTGPFGGVLACRHLLATATNLLVFAGDGLYEADFAAILADHCERHAELTIGVASVDDGSQYGIVSTDCDGRVTQMHEKPPGVGRVQNASCGVYVVSKRLVSRFSDVARSLDWIDVVSILLEERALVQTARVDDWRDVGTPSDLLRVNMALLAGDQISLVAKKVDTIDASVWTQGIQQTDFSGVTFEGRVLVGANADLRPGAVIGNSVIGHSARIEADAQVHDAVILSGARVPAGSAVVGTVWR